MNRHSTLATYLHMLLLAVCGRFCVSGGNVIPGSVVPLGGHNDERLEKTWRTIETNFPAIMGYFPPNVMSEEILSDKDDRIRTVVISSSNPLRSYADTTAYEEAFKKLDLLVTVEITMTETAELSDYVLPARSAYESYDGTFFPWNYPEIFFQMRHPVVEPTPQTRESGSILASIGKATGIIPNLPQYLYDAGRKDRREYTAALFTWMNSNRKFIRQLPLVINETRRKSTESVNLDILWGIFLASPSAFRKNVTRVGIPVPSIIKSIKNPKRVFTAFKGVIKYRSIAPLALLSPKIVHAEMTYERVLDSRSGLWIGKVSDTNMDELRTKDKKINLYIPEMEGWMDEIEPDNEEQALVPDAEFPLILNAGRHKPENANTLMRKPQWNKGRRTCTLAMNPEDAVELEIKDGETVKVVTETAEEHIELEISNEIRRGQVHIPHGFGLKYKGEIHGVNVNRLTKNTHRDRIAATPLHRYVPCRVEKNLISEKNHIINIAHLS